MNRSLAILDFGWDIRDIWWLEGCDKIGKGIFSMGLGYVGKEGGAGNESGRVVGYSAARCAKGSKGESIYGKWKKQSTGFEGKGGVRRTVGEEKSEIREETLRLLSRIHLLLILILGRVVENLIRITRKEVDYEDYGYL